MSLNNGYKPNPHYYTSLVKDFHETFEVKTYKHPDNAPMDVHKLRARLIREELQEYHDAYDTLACLDALCDSLYVVAGTAVTYSTPLVALPFYNDDGINNLDASARPLLNDLDSMFPCQKNLNVSISLYMNKLESVAVHRKFMIREAFMAVHINNMNKLWDYNPLEKLAVIPYIVVAKGNKFLVKDLGGKVIKPPDHQKVDLSDFI
jgi:uncharacterized protein Smg (DUF494 family)